MIKLYKKIVIQIWVFMDAFQTFYTISHHAKSDIAILPPEDLQAEQTAND